MLTFGQHVLGLRGTIVAVSTIKVGDHILFLEKQVDLGNSSPIRVDLVEEGRSQVVINGTSSIGLVIYRRLHRNTLVLKLDPGQV